MPYTVRIDDDAPTITDDIEDAVDLIWHHLLTPTGTANGGHYQLTTPTGGVYSGHLFPLTADPDQPANHDTQRWASWLAEAFDELSLQIRED